MFGMELIRILEGFFREVEEKDISLEQVKWELDNFIYPFIGSKIAEGSLSKEEAIELIRYCERKLKELGN